MAFTFSVSDDLRAFGMSGNRSGAHLARSMMFSEIETLLGLTTEATSLAEIKALIEEENILAKPTEGSRRKTFTHLRSLYGLETTFPLFRILRSLGEESAEDLPLLAMLCCYCRDEQLRASFPPVSRMRPGQQVTRVVVEEHVEELWPGRFSSVMKESLAQHTNTTWTVAGHLSGRSKKIRTVPKPGWAATTYAMLIGYQLGLRGQNLLHSVFGELVAASPEQILAHLQTAASRGWVRLRHGGGVVEIDFADLPAIQPHSAHV
jgi:hypothetical protein